MKQNTYLLKEVRNTGYWDKGFVSRLMSRNTNDTVAASNHWLGDLDKFYSFIICVQTYEDTIQEFTSMGNLHQSSVGVWVLVLLAARTNCLLLY